MTFLRAYNDRPFAFEGLAMVGLLATLYALVILLQSTFIEGIPEMRRLHREFVKGAIITACHLLFWLGLLVYTIVRPFF